MERLERIVELPAVQRRQYGERQAQERERMPVKHRETPPPQFPGIQRFANKNYSQ
jgi:hypothetical protein